MPLLTSTGHIAVDHFHSGRGTMSYYVLGDTVQFQARNGDTFYIAYRDVRNPVTGTPFNSISEFVSWLDSSTFS